jgi:4-amino-4-deoxy-L-arabinose transferase-like glycosyltransferase
MLTVFVAVAVLLAVGLALGRGPLFRVLVSVLALLVFVLVTVPWLLLMAVVEVEGRLAAAALASYLSAQRASALDPALVLRGG